MQTSRSIWRLLRCLLFVRQRWARRLKQQLDAERHSSRMKDREIESLRVQLEAYRDTVESLGWEARASGAEAKVYAESLRRQ